MTALTLTEKVVRTIEGVNFGYLAVVLKDGSPHVTPMWVDLEGGLILVNTVIGRVKQRATKRSPRVALSIANTLNQYEMVMIRGTVVEQTTEGAEGHIDKLAKKYLGVDRYQWRSPNDRRIILKIRPEYVFGG